MTDRCNDYCCNHGCNQGRHCPARVAKVASRMHDAEALPPGRWREWLQDLARAFVLIFTMMFLGAILAPTVVGLFR